MMTPRKRQITIILILVIIVLLIVWLLSFLFRSSSEPLIPLDSTKTEQVGDVPATLSEQAEQKEQTQRDTSSDVISLSKIFVERYGSYSNESNFANTKDVLPLMTQKLASASQNYIDNAKVPEGYYGITTRVVSVKVNSFDESAGVGTLLVSTQREESKDSPQNATVKYQDIELKFIKEAGVWKIDSATWL